MSTPRKRTAAEVERVQQVNLLARLWQSKALAEGLLSGQMTVLTVLKDGFAAWLQQYTKVYLHDGLKRRGSQQINRTKLTGYITYLGANRRRAGESSVLMAAAVIETRRVAEARRDSKGRREPFPRADNDTARALRERYQRVASRILARAFQPIAGWDRLAWMFEESIWKNQINWTETLDELAREDAARLDKVP